MARALESLQLRDYRAFRSFKLADVSRVNLIVGRNNAGKTSILEAIRLLASGGDLGVFYQIAIERGEVLTVQSEVDPEFRNDALPTIAHFFHGHDFGLGSEFEIKSQSGLGSLSVTAIDGANVNAYQRLVTGNKDALFPDAFKTGRLAVHIWTQQTSPGGGDLFPVNDEGVFNPTLASLVGGRTAPRPPRTESTPVVAITPSSLFASQMVGMWERVVREGREVDVVDALRVLEPDIEDVVFLPGERAARGRGGVLVSRKGSKRRVPLGSMGEGMRRMLALAISLEQARKGFLLIDEIDTGLHWSVMSQMWTLVQRAASEFDVQVFATTHSLDCLRGLRDAADAHSDLRDSVRVHKVDTTLQQAVTLAADELSVVVEREIEVRG